MLCCGAALCIVAHLAALGAHWMTLALLTLDITVKSNSRHCPMSLEGKNLYSLRTTALEYERKDLNFFFVVQNGYHHPVTSLGFQAPARPPPLCVVETSHTVHVKDPPHLAAALFCFFSTCPPLSIPSAALLTRFYISLSGFQ